MSAQCLTTCRGSRSQKRWAVVMTVAMLISFGGGPGFMPAVKAQTTPLVGAGFSLDAGDLRFIFHQIEIAQAHSASPLAPGGDPCAALFGSGENQVNERRFPFGLRTVDGSCNHLTPGQTAFGASDQLFPRLTTRFPRTAEDGTSYEQTAPDSVVVDSQPRIISNLIVDQTIFNPAAAALADPADGRAVQLGSADCPPGSSPRCTSTFFIPNVAPDVGLSAPFNVMFTFFGQFFDHGLDLVNKGGSGTVFVPLQADDPLFVTGGPNLMLLTRATRPAPGSLEAINQTTPFVDQNQTYTSHPSHQAFLREYELDAGGRPRSTGRMIDGVGGNIGNWAEVKAQALTMFGIVLQDSAVFNVPLLVTDAYGYLRRTADGFPMAMLANGPGPADDTVVVLDTNPLTAPIQSSALAGTNHEFLNDIAHNAVPGPGLVRDNNGLISNAGDPQAPGTYDGELLDRHFVTGDGRGNENIALTAVHTIFHSEHNRLEANIRALIDNNTLGLTAAEQTAWKAGPAGVPSGWDYGERLFQAARFVTEMQYQHLVFEEFARTLVPSINVFIGDGINFQSDTNPAIFAEFAHQAYRLGHTMLTETISRARANGTSYDIPLLAGFLNPVEFNRNPDAPLVPLTAGQAAGAIFQGGTRQIGNDIDEFVTEAVRNNLVGLPLDLAVLNLARGRSEGVAPLNEVRRQLFAATSDFALEPYANWFEFKLGMKHQESLINFIAAYGVHPDLEAATTLAAKRLAAGGLAFDFDFLFSPAADSGVDRIDLWVGGIAEKLAPFGSMLGSTFNYIFEHQMENLQNADRFYYLERLDGMNLLAQLEGNSFTELITRNTEAVGLPASVFSRPDFIFNVSNLGTTGLILDDPTTPYDESDTFAEPGMHLVRHPDGTIQYFGPAHVVWNGSNSGTVGDRIVSSEGDDTLSGNGGNDILEGGDGNDQHIGGAGDDILTDTFGEDVIKGGPGNDAISGGRGPFDLLQGNDGNDFIVGGDDVSETFGGPGNDIIFSGQGATEMFGGAGDDWIEGGPQLDLLVGDENNQFQNDPNQGHDVIIGGKGDDDYDSEGGDDIMIADVLGTERLEGMLGWDWVTYRGDPLPVDADMRIRVVLPPDLDELRDRFDLAEALSGWDKDDMLRGDDRVADGDIAPDHTLRAAGIDRITGLRPLLVALLGPTANLPAFTFDGGNIIMGGLGSDLIEGRGGNDLIDGDVWLNAQLGVLNLATPDPNDFVRTVDSLHALKADVFAGLLNPGNIRIVRSIVNSGSAGVDTARFSGPRADYTIVGPTAGITTVIDNVGLDGTDTLRNIEFLEFPVDNGPDGLPRTGDETVFVRVSTGNNPPTGAPTLSQPLPQEGEQLSVQNGTIADLDGIVAGTFGFQWQQGVVGGAFADIPGATLRQFTPAQAQVGQLLRAAISLTDSGGRRESVTSLPSGVVGDVFVGGTGADLFNGTDGRDDADGNAGNDILNTGDAADVAVGNGGNDTLNMGAGNDTATGGAGNDTILAGDGNDTIIYNAAEGFDVVDGGGGVDVIRVTGPDAVIGLSTLTGVETITGVVGGNVTIQGSEAANTLNFSAVTLTGINSINGGGGNDVITGGAGGDTINGEAGADTINGGPGADTISGAGGADIINGDNGADDINGGAGNDTLNGGAGADTINGGADNDDLTGGPGNDIMNGGTGLNVFRFAAAFDADTINAFDANATGGQDLLNLAALGVTQANFGTRVSIAASPLGGTLITVRVGAVGTTTLGTIRLAGVAPAAVTAGAAGDFILAP